MDALGSVSQWVELVKTEDHSLAAQRLYERYVAALLRATRNLARGMPRSFIDEEDLVQEAFGHFFAGIRRQRFPRLNDRDDVWQILIMLAHRRAVEACRYLRAQRRTTARVECTAGTNRCDGHSREIHSVVSRESSPYILAELADEVQFRLDQLNDPQLRRLALMKIHGHTHLEIAERLDCSVRTVERKIRVIKKIWSRGG
ncbi:MAG: hypothetical protein D6753_13600 [Planctomycetota bacterium]|nr:MAG: hypothetical protein D6753_13600 [Planctomycetota bacterium]